MPGPSALIEHVRILAAIILFLCAPVIAGCAGLNYENPLTATRGVKSQHSSGDGAFPAVGVSPAPPGPTMTPTERAQALQELSAARAKNQAAAGASTAQPLAR